MVADDDDISDDCGGGLGFIPLQTLVVYVLDDCNRSVCWITRLGMFPGPIVLEGCDDRKCFRTGCNLLAVVQVIAQVACVVTFCCKCAQTCT